MRVSEGGVSIWFGTPDAPAPSGVVAAGDTSITIGLKPPDPAARITILYRINHGGPRTVAAQPTRRDAPGTQYYRAQPTGFKEGDKVEYVAIYRSGSRQIPSNAEAESHVTTFSLATAADADAAAGAHHAASHEQHGPDAENLQEAMRGVLHAAKALNSRALEDSFIKLYFAHQGEPQSFWAEAAKHADLKPHIERLQFALQLDHLTAGHLPLIAALAQRLGVKSMEDLAHLDDAVWHQLIEKTGAPPHFPGASPKAQAEAYAASIQATLQAAFPNLAVIRIARSSDHVDELAIRFLENSPDFDIRKARIDAYADHHGAAAFKGIPEAKRADTLKEVKRVQRLFAASTNAEVFRALLGTRFDSAHAIAVVPRASFVSHYGHLFGGEGAAHEVHERAQLGRI
jgi:hypothetical protein